MNRNHGPDAANDHAALRREALGAMWTAWWQARRKRRGADVGALLPPVAPGAVAGVDPERIYGTVDRLARVVFFWKFDKRCFYRSFAVAAVLRRRGFPAGLEFGLRLAGNRRKQCHCWVAIGDRVVGEASDPHRLFPLPAGQWGDNVRYWLADDDEGRPSC